MPLFSSTEVISFSITLALGSFGLFKALFERDFERKNARFKKESQKWLNSQISDFLTTIQSKVSKRATPDEVLAEMNTWVQRQANLVGLTEGFEALDLTSKRILYALGAAIVCGFLGLGYPGVINSGASNPLYWSDLGALLFGLGTFLVFQYMFDYRRISKRMSKLEQGAPFEKIFEEELSEED